MGWNDLLGHVEIVDQFRRCVQRGRLASSFLFVGPSGVGKCTFARNLAQVLLCEHGSSEGFDACGACPACVQVDAGTHPDFMVLTKPADKNFLPLELFIGDKEHRMREGLCYQIGLKPYHGGRKIAIIDDADYLNAESANCLLKTLEEPPPRSVLILIGTTEHKQLPTIRSRCQIIRFRPLDATAVARLLVDKGMVTDKGQAQKIARLAAGSLERALHFGDPELMGFRQQLYAYLAQPNVDSVQFSKALVAFVDEAGKDAPPRRHRMRQIIGFATDFYAELLRCLAQLPPNNSDTVLQDAVTSAKSGWRGDMNMAAMRLQRCLAAMDHVASNANQATLLECWLDEMTMDGVPQ